MITIDTMRLLSLAITDGNKVVTFTSKGVYTFPNRRLARKHDSNKLPHITFSIRELIGGLYVDTTPIYPHLVNI